MASGFFIGLFFMLLLVIYLFDSIPGFPFNTYLILMFATFVGFIVCFVMGSQNPANVNDSPDFEKGYKTARDAFQFSVPCHVCGRPAIISDDLDISNAVKNKLESLKISHKECQSVVKP